MNFDHSGNFNSLTNKQVSELLKAYSGLCSIVNKFPVKLLSELLNLEEKYDIKKYIELARPYLYSPDISEKFSQVEAEYKKFDKLMPS